MNQTTLVVDARKVRIVSQKLNRKARIRDVAIVRNNLVVRQKKDLFHVARPGRDSAVLDSACSCTPFNVSKCAPRIIPDSRNAFRPARGNCESKLARSR